MQKIFSILVIAFLAITISAQQAPNSSVVLPQLGVKDKAIEATLTEISDYIRSKPQGLRFPVTKIIFTEAKGCLSYTIEGIDNTWANLFNYDEASYGYAVVSNRLFLIMSLRSENLDLNNIFSVVGGQKTFSRNILPPTGITKRPIWVYDYADNKANKILEEDLDILEK